LIDVPFKEDSLMVASRPKIGLALSGGGMRGLAHIGVLKVLEREGFPVDLLAGTSMGGLVGAAYAAGLSIEHIEQQALHMGSLRQIIPFFDRSISNPSVLQGEKVEAYLQELLGDVCFEELRIPLAVVAVDLNREEKVVLREGRVRDAVRATIALPGLFTPVKRGDRLLVDGGLLDNLPADVVRGMGAERVVAVDISTSRETVSLFTERLYRHRFMPSGFVELLEVLWRSLNVMMHEMDRQCMERAETDLLIQPSLPAGVTVLTGFSRVEETIRSGARATEEALPRLERLLQWD
jgi:NTE family protein